MSFRVGKFTVKNIVGMRVTEDGKEEFELEWANTWECPEIVTELAPKLLEEFLAKKEEEADDIEVDEEEEEEEEPNLEDLFSSSKSTKTGGFFSGGGINAVISRLQKNKKEELSKQPFPRGQNTNVLANSGVFTEALDLSRVTPEETPTVYVTSNGSVQAFDAAQISVYTPKYPISPREAVEARDGGVLPVQAAAMPQQQVSPRLPAGTVPPHTAGRTQSVSTSLQSLKTNVDNIPRLFTPEGLDPVAMQKIFPAQEAPQRSHSVPGLQSIILKCGICSEMFYEECKFTQHMFMHEQVNLLKQDPPKLLKPGTFQCKFCHLLFDDKDKLKLHYSEQHEKEFVYTQPLDQLYQCTLCELTFVDYGKLLKHHQIHGRREVFILPKKPVESTTTNNVTIIRTSTSSTTSSLENHSIDGKLVPSLKQEDDDNVFEDGHLKLSGEIMTTLDFQPVNEALLSKTASQTGEKKMYRCNLCDELFENESDRANHSLIHVNRSSSLDCHICGKQFKHRTNLSTHLVVHSGVKPHQCHICLRRFTQKVNLQRHMHIHDGSRPFTCKFCAKSFTQRANLQRHVLSHTEQPKDEITKALNEIPNESEVNNAINESLAEAMTAIIEGKSLTDKADFRCDICDKIFAQKVNLQKHMLIHSGSRPFQCYVCGKAFRQRASLQKHYTVHTNGSTSFICQTCNRLFVSRTNLQRHMLVHAMPGMKQCYLCDQKFTTSDNLERHFSEHIEEATPNIALPQKYFEQSTPGQTFRCATCDIVFDSPIIFSQHLQCHQRGFSPDTTPGDIGDITKAYEENQACPLQCNTCGVIFMSVAKLEAHMTTHADDASPSGTKHTIGVMISSSDASESPTVVASTSAVAGDHCTALNSTASTSDISEIIKPEEKTSNRVSRCPVCKEMFPSKAEMREHYSEAHLDTPTVASSVATVFYQVDGQLYTASPIAGMTHGAPMEYDAPKPSEVLTENEEVLIKENEEFIKDNILGGSKEYETKGRYERGNYSCKICNRVLTYKYSLEKHMLLHTGSFPYKCTLCSKRFNHKANLDKHLVVHSGEKPYSCHICARPFSQKSNLQRHQLTHTQNRDFVCEVCGKRFNHMASLKTHSLIHTGAKPFSCYICSKRFNQKGNLKRHVQTHKSGKRNKVNGVPTPKVPPSVKDEDLMKYDEEELVDKPVLKTEEDTPTMTDEEDLSDTPSRRSNRVRTKKTMDDFEFDENEPLPTMISNDTSLNQSNDASSQGSLDQSHDVPMQESMVSHEVSMHGSVGSFEMSEEEEEEEEEGILTVVPSDALEEPVSMVASHNSHLLPTDDEKKESFHCDSCSKLFVSMASLEAHKRSAHSHIMCNMCGKKFSQKANLLKHKLIHADKKPFECRVCHKAFRQKANLQRHELIHNKDRKTVSCALCKKSFRCAWSLKQHMKNHAAAGETMPFGCSVCGQIFKERSEFQKHFKIHSKADSGTNEASTDLMQPNPESLQTLLMEADKSGSEVLVLLDGGNTETQMITMDNNNDILVVTNENNEIQVS